MPKNTQNPRRLDRARSEIYRRRTSMESMRTNIRNTFLEKLRKSRSKSVDRLRQIVEKCDNNVEYRSLNELRQVLLNDKEIPDLCSDDVSDLLREVEEELRQVNLEYEVEKYEKESQKENEDAVNRLMTQCQICDALSLDPICVKCNSQISSEFF